MYVNNKYMPVSICHCGAFILTGWELVFQVRPRFLSWLIYELLLSLVTGEGGFVEDCFHVT